MLLFLLGWFAFGSIFSGISWGLFSFLIEPAVYIALFGIPITGGLAIIFGLISVTKGYKLGFAGIISGAIPLSVVLVLFLH
jgi:hypothetical protein